MTSHSISESSDFCWRSSTKDALSSERLDEGARPVFSKQLVLGCDNIQNFVPEYIREKFQERIEPNLCTIKAICKAEHKETLYTFVLSWYKNLAHVDTDSSAPISKSKKSPIRVTSIDELKGQRPMRSPETTVKIGIAPSSGEQTRRCDGPCGKMRLVKELRVHGRCEHAICLFCTINAPMIRDEDGSVGCCNRECFAIDLAAVCPDPALRHKYFQKIINKCKVDKITAKGSGNNMIKLEQATVPSWKFLENAVELESSASRTSSVNKSSETKRGLEELMYVKVLVLEKGPMETIYRRHFVAEIGSMESLRDTLQWIVGYGQNLHKSRIFFNCGGNDEDAKLQEIDMEKYGDKKISNFPSINGMLSFVVDYKNVIGGNSFSPYV